MRRTATIEENVLRVLGHYGTAGSLAVTKVLPTGVRGWPVDDRLLRLVYFGGWVEDPAFAAEHHHGTKFARREPGGVSPNLHIVFYPLKDPGGWPWPYFVEAHLDFHAADFKHPDQLIEHGLEVAANAITGRVTDQVEIAEALDRRFGAETGGQSGESG